MIARMLGYCTASVAAFGLFSGPANAGFYSGSQLYEVCTAKRSSKAYIENMYECVAYIAGAVDAFNTTREATKLKRCIPADVTVSKLKDVTVKYMRDRPADHGKSASALVLAATRKAWPCSTKKQK